MTEAKKESTKYEIDMCNGPLLSKILLFSLPLMLSGILQLCFNAADMIVVGRWVGSDALAAVGSTGPLINLMVNVFLGLSVGANVLVARYYGAGQEHELSEMVHTAILTSVICGILLIFIGYYTAPFALQAMGAPIEVIDQSIIYIRIYFAAMPAMMLYNFGAAILRAVGDTRRPLFFLTIAGVINVILNLIFVIVFSLGVMGVALATAISQVISAALVVICLMKSKSAYGLRLNDLKISKHKLKLMAKIGLPAGLQGAIFSISNVLIQSSVNSFGFIAMAGNSAAGNLEGFVYTAMNTMHQTAVSFVGQNYGANKYKRIKTIAIQCICIVTVVGLVLGNIVHFLGPVLLKLYTTDPEVISFGMRRLFYICGPYFLCGVMDTLVGCLRGMGRSILPMLVSLTGACLFRIIWIYTVFATNRTLEVLYISYPISWTITALVHFICFMLIYRKVRNHMIKKP
ncbi:MAG TPA: MATE family efflux transporter [Lachnospiraceae bacterium]|nr:MATE family efflux transporter [Lachnospiraceae bacterium]